MGTSNFYVENASKVFALLPSEEDEPILWWDDTKMWIEDTLNENGYRECSSGTERDAERIAVKSIDRQFMGVWVEVSITSIVRYGYYEGASLDWDVSIHIGAVEYDVAVFERFCAEDLECASDESYGLCKANAPKLVAWVERAKNDLVEELEKIYEQLSIPLRVAARFSNGETIYAKA